MTRFPFAEPSAHYHPGFASCSCDQCCTREGWFASAEPAKISAKRANLNGEQEIPVGEGQDRIHGARVAARMAEPDASSSTSSALPACTAFNAAKNGSTATWTWTISNLAHRRAESCDGRDPLESARNAFGRSGSGRRQQSFSVFLIFICNVN